jgi:hypothetical protein
MTQLKTNPIVQTHYKKNGIIALKKQVDVNHVMLAKKFEEEVNSPLRDVLQKQPVIKRPNVKSFWCKTSFFKRMLCNENKFCKTLPFWLLEIISLFNLLRALG